MYARFNTIFPVLALTIAALAPVAAAHAASNKHLFGDWGGLWTRLADDGIDVQAKYESDTAWNPSGGKSQAARYADQWLLAASLDLGKLANIDGAKVYVSLSRRDGRSLSKDAIGNQLPVQEIYGGGQDFRLDDLWYQQTFDQGHWEARFGRVHTSDDFAHFSCAFQNLGFCAAPYAILADSGWSQFPVAVWGVRIKYMSGPWYVQTGAFQVNPSYGRHANGFKLDFSGTTGVIAPVEIGVLPKLGAQNLSGEYKLGLYYDSSDTQDVYEDVTGRPAALTGLPARVRNGRYGGYVMAQQQLSTPSAGSTRGLTMFAHLTLADRNTALIRDSLTLGLSYEGPFAARAHDRAEFAVARYAFNERLAHYQRLLNTTAAGPVGVQGAETDFNLQYNLALTPWCTLGPNLQYVIHPNGLHTIDDAFVVGLQAKVTF